MRSEFFLLLFCLGWSACSGSSTRTNPSAIVESVEEAEFEINVSETGSARIIARFLPDGSLRTDLHVPIGAANALEVSPEGASHHSLRVIRKETDLRHALIEVRSRSSDAPIYLSTSIDLNELRAKGVSLWEVLVFPKRFESGLEKTRGEFRIRFKTQDPKWHFLGPQRGNPHELLGHGGLLRGQFDFFPMGTVPTTNRALSFWVPHEGAALKVIEKAFSQSDLERAADLVDKLNLREKVEAPFDWIFWNSSLGSGGAVGLNFSRGHAVILGVPSLVDLTLAYFKSALFDGENQKADWFWDGVLRFWVRKKLLSEKLITVDQFFQDLAQSLTPEGLAKRGGDLLSFRWNREMMDSQVAPATLDGVLVEFFSGERDGAAVSKEDTQEDWSEDFGHRRSIERRFDDLVRRSRPQGVSSDLAVLENSVEAVSRNLSNYLGGKSCVDGTRLKFLAKTPEETVRCLRFLNDP